VKVVRPRDWEDGEGKLDVDDSAADATKDIDGVGVWRLRKLRLITPWWIRRRIINREKVSKPDRDTEGRGG